MRLRLDVRQNVRDDGGAAAADALGHGDVSVGRSVGVRKRQHVLYDLALLLIGCLLERVLVPLEIERLPLRLVEQPLDKRWFHDVSLSFLLPTRWTSLARLLPGGEPKHQVNRGQVDVEHPCQPSRFVLTRLLVGVVVADCEAVRDIEKVVVVLLEQVHLHPSLDFHATKSPNAADA